MKGLAFFFDVFGRTRRRDFWLFTVGLLAFYTFVLGSGAFGAGDVRGHAAFYGQLPLTVLQAMLSTDYGFIAFAVLQVVTIAVLIRRCHDRNLSGFGLLAVLVPVLGWLWLFVELGLKAGTDGANDYGPSPKSGYRTLS